MTAHKLKWSADGHHPAMTLVRREARLEGYTGKLGFAEFVRERYDARLLFDKYSDIYGIEFKNDDKAVEFMLKMGPL